MNTSEHMWISESLIQNLSVLFKDLIQNVNDEYELSNPDKSVLIIAKNFSETLFFQFMYLEGHLWSSPVGINLTTDYFCVNHLTLVELCKRGVLTIWGECQPSYYEFVVNIHDDLCALFEEMLFRVSSLEIAIVARRLKGTTNVLCERKFGEFPNIPFNNLDCLEEHNPPLDNNTYHVKLFSCEYIVEDMLLCYWMSFNKNCLE
jgi:hypothetical protein